MRRFWICKHLWIAWTVLVLFTQSAVAEEKDIQKAPVAIPIGAFEFAPMLEVAESYNDNIFHRNALRKDSLVTQIHAGGQLSLEHKFNQYKLTYLLQSSHYHNSPENDYIDHYVGINTHTEFTSRHRLNIDAKYFDGHYMRGVFLNRDILEPSFEQTTPDEYRLYGGTIIYQYGHQRARGNLEMVLGVNDFTFSNHRERTVQQDRTMIEATSGFYFRLMPNTRLLAQVENVWLNHKDPNSTRVDFLKQRFLMGITWSYSTKTQGMARIGYLRQDYEDTSISDYNGVTWDLSMRWSPLTYSKFDLSISRDVHPSISGVNLRDSDRFRLGWVHDWTNRVSSNMNAAYESATNSSTQRKDDYISFGVDLRYGFRRWLGLGISYEFRQLQSSTSVFDFDQNIVMVYIAGNPRISDEVRAPWASWY